jgi:tetratricopeptide (TPR) repeat protein
MKLTPSDPRKKRNVSPAGKNPGLGDRDPFGMREKYFHSLGAAFCDERRFEEATGALRQALLLDDTAYTRHHLSLAFLGKGELDAALREASRAIDLAPMAPEYYYERSLIRRAAGDTAGASADLMRSIEIDGNYGRIDEIKSAIASVRHAFDDPEMEEWLKGARIKDPELRIMAERMDESLRSDYEAVARSSCPVHACPAYCCHFTGPMVRHGVTMGAWKLHCIKDFLKEKSLQYEDFIDRMPYHGEEYLQDLIPPPYFIKEGDGHSVFFPKRARESATAAMLRDLPKGQDYQTLMWINESARPCIFLTLGKCMIHDAGDEAGLPACKQFLCLTGFVFVVLHRLGITGPALLVGRTIAELNRIALEALLILSREVYGRSDIIELGNARKDALKAAARADKSRDKPDLAAKIGEYSRLSRKYEELMITRKESARREMENLAAGR